MAGFASRMKNKDVCKLDSAYWSPGVVRAKKILLGGRVGYRLLLISNARDFKIVGVPTLTLDLYSSAISIARNRIRTLLVDSRGLSWGWKYKSDVT